jgi:hypothetical protein
MLRVIERLRNVLQNLGVAVRMNITPVEDVQEDLLSAIQRTLVRE